MSDVRACASFLFLVLCTLHLDLGTGEACADSVLEDDVPILRLACRFSLSLDFGLLGRPSIR
jgi:hypothetical protein